MEAIVTLKYAADSGLFGGKAAHLARMIKAGLPVPDGMAVGLMAFDDDGTLRDEVKRTLNQSLQDGKLYAVRSSALSEDAEDASWAGQFETFLNTPSAKVVAKVEECHNSVKQRAATYAADKKLPGDGFDIAVVIQGMLTPDYAGVLFTKNPVSGENASVIEYVSGLGEGLVSGRLDPTRLVISADNVGPVPKAPFDIVRLLELARQVEVLFGGPQDIEWVSTDTVIWLVQARPITAVQQVSQGNYLGEPKDVFYWGPSRAQKLYMSDFMAAVEHQMVHMSKDDSLPSPPRTVVLFNKGKMVWLSDLQAFTKFTEQTFEAYEKLDRINDDRANWRASGNLLVEAWVHTEFAEFALYGATTVLNKRLQRFDSRVKQDIWGAFTIPDKPSFLTQIDSELATSQDPEALAGAYPWIQDGYGGLVADVVPYFTERLKIVSSGKRGKDNQDILAKRQQLVETHGLSIQEVKALSLVRDLAEFMDDRKAWMMQTRRLITEPFGSIEHGWSFNDGKASNLDQSTSLQLWERYVSFKVSSNVVSGTVASNGGRHFIDGEIAVVTGPADVVADDKIVVVPSTSPTYIPIMRKARALITDHGGMMSHAAIVAREFNLPCIVGTKQGTKVLKTGDKVVLDLVRGEVNF